MILLPGIRLSVTIDPNTDMQTAHVSVALGRGQAVEVQADRLSVLGALAMLGVRDVEWPRTPEEAMHAFLTDRVPEESFEERKP